MSVVDVVAAFAVTAAALYGLGLPIAWLLPAPVGQAWVFRIAVAPLYAIVVATVGAQLLGLLGVPLHPLQLAAVTGIAWLAAALRHGASWRRGFGAGATWPVTMVVSSLVLWGFSLVGYGLYLPNRDFKNHAYWIAMVAFRRTADPAQVLATSPVSGTEEKLFYPLGLHTLLGWALPTTGWSSIGVTAAAVVLVTAVSLPLGMMALARLWEPDDVVLHRVAAFAGVCLPGFSLGFSIGSVTMLTGTALYSAALAQAWFTILRPEPSAVAALGVVALGLYHLHLGEAVALFLVTLAAAVVLRPLRRVRWSWRMLAAVALPLALGILTVAPSIARLGGRASANWDDLRESLTFLVSWLIPLIVQPRGPTILAVVWLGLTVAGIWLAYRQRLSAVPLLALAVPMVLSFVAATTGMPDWLVLLTAPWYGSTARISVLAAPSLALLGSLSIAHLLAARHPLPRLALPIVGVVLAGGMAADAVAERRAELRAGLAGAGNTPAVARFLADRLQPGETVLNFEGDGTSNLFAFRRIPVIDGYRIDVPAGGSKERPLDQLQAMLLHLDDPAVASALDDLGVRYVAMGTTTPYWDVILGHVWQQLARQPQLRLAHLGSDMVVLEYRPQP